MVLAPECSFKWDGAALSIVLGAIPLAIALTVATLLIAQAAVVISNRLHAAILAAMLGKTTILLSGHPYGKLEACYESSLKNYPNVFLW